MRTRILFFGLAVCLASFITGCSKPAVDKDFVVATEPLIGRWLRPNDGYVLMVNRLEPEGRLGASYFNPNPIHVSAVQASVEGNSVKLFVELNDEGYPGCTYNLTYKKSKDQLVGVYYQAAMQQSFDIVFERAQ